ncbi:hypothetical protein CBR_g19553 [Chara braunii]|uniref:HAT C-terminal dimerisation domain-containing protein n=1 Tax=Chara braunii TaxID=69332 RepID=A0A388KYA0_CHABU|nr:hypothetical protein CBR_g19553 [Chara braunii]|eukprot:GBG75040.1 hypothetical protein CBR_g19553 [Chara braunii]
MLHDNAWASIPWEWRLIPQARWVRLQIHDGQFLRHVEFAILVMEPVHQLLRRMDRGGMMMSIVYEWSQHLVRLMRLMPVLAEFLACVGEVEMRLMHLLEPAHAAAHLLNPRRRSLKYFESLHTTSEDVEVIRECDRFLLAQTGGDSTGRDYLIVRAQIRHFHARRGNWGDLSMSAGGSPTASRCAAWWFAHGVAHPELRSIAIRVMHMWASAAERNWAEHECILTAKRNKLGFAKLAQLVEITTNLKLASCRQHGGGYVLPWIMDREREEQRPPAAAGEDEEDADPELDAWGARLAGTVSDAELRRQIDVFLPTLLPYEHVPPPAQDAGVEGMQVGEYDWTDPEDLVSGGDRTAEQVHFTYGAGSDGLASRTPVITGDGLLRTEGVVDRPSPSPPAGHSGQPWRERDIQLPPLPRGQVHGVDSSGEDEGKTEEHLTNARFAPSHHSFARAWELRRSRRLAGQGAERGAHSQHLDEIPAGEQTPVTPAHGRDRQDAHDMPSSLRTSDFDVAGSHGRSLVLRYRFTEKPVQARDTSQREKTEEERDTRIDHEEEARLWSMPSGGPPVGVPTGASDRAVEGEHAPEREGDSDGRPVGDDSDQDARDDSSDATHEGEATDVGGFIDRVIVGLCAGDMEGGTPGGHGTSQGGDAVMDEEPGLHTDRQGSDSGAGHSPVMEGVVDVDDEARLSLTQDVAGDMSLKLVVRTPLPVHADEGDRGRRFNERLGESTPPPLNQE